jgi:hypothetical protein
MARASRRRRIEPTDDWEQLELLCLWPEQRDYELIRPLVLFGSPASERAQETAAVSERTLRRKTRRFEAEGMLGASSAPSMPESADSHPPCAACGDSFHGLNIRGGSS